MKKEKKGKQDRAGSSFEQMSKTRKLESIFLFVTGKCNAKCKMCFYADDMDMKEADLTFEEMRKLSETAGEFNRLWLSGGEPTLREDLPEIIEMFYKNNKVKDINMPTNGLKPDRVVEWVKRLRQSCPDCSITVSISLDGFGDTHDTQRGVPGNFYKAIETMQKLTENFKDDKKVLKNATTVITRYNVDEVLDFMMWMFGRFDTSTHTIEAARGETREDGVKVLTESSLKKLQDEMAPIYSAYADRMVKDDQGMRKFMTKFFFLGLIRTLYDVRASNIDKPTPWGMDCTAGETTLVVDYDGRFRSCELREPIGNVKDYGCDVMQIMHGEAMKNEVDEIGYGDKANCWCTHGCWIMSSIIFNPKKMIAKVFKGYRQTKKLSKPLTFEESFLQGLEAKYNLDREKLQKLNIVK
ncbi:radical SAM protein [Bacteroidales bacterium OttesenSCG-928-B11]|nr:radical SAM protein [Bacteroidales bacterium OttesenSCG-928-B11]MDL2326056.1 radical SAM protein [Bacteroidales bacterium OttesenSCG-928-A14]